jgi:hypothetical protein
LVGIVGSIGFTWPIYTVIKQPIKPMEQIKQIQHSLNVLSVSYQLTKGKREVRGERVKMDSGKGKIAVLRTMQGD